MQRIQLAEDIQPLSEFRANVASYIEKVRKTKRPLVITQRGKSAAIIMDVAEYEKLVEKLELFTDIQIAESQLKRGEGISHEEDETPDAEELKAIKEAKEDIATGRTRPYSEFTKEFGL